MRYITGHNPLFIPRYVPKIDKSVVKPFEKGNLGKDRLYILYKR
jgi:hypothetical protein